MNAIKTEPLENAIKHKSVTKINQTRMNVIPLIKETSVEREIYYNLRVTSNIHARKLGLEPMD